MEKYDRNLVCVQIYHAEYYLREAGQIIRIDPLNLKTLSAVLRKTEKLTADALATILNYQRGEGKTT